MRQIEPYDDSTEIASDAPLWADSAPIQICERSEMSTASKLAVADIPTHHFEDFEEVASDTPMWRD